MVTTWVVVGCLILVAFGCTLLYWTAGFLVWFLKWLNKPKKKTRRVESRLERDIREFEAELELAPVENETEEREHEQPPVRAPTKRYFIVLGSLGLQEIDKSEIASMKRQHYKVVDESGAPV